jgi:hypothetical protein
VSLTPAISTTTLSARRAHRRSTRSRSFWTSACIASKYSFSADDQSQADKLFRGASLSNDGTESKTAIMPDGVSD